MGSIQERPLLRIGDDVVVLDERFLLERFTRGLYWLVHDNEKTSHGDSCRQAWTEAHGEMHELLVEDYMTEFAPYIVGGGSAVFTEGTLGAAFGGKRADVGIDFGGTVLIADAQGGQVSTATRELGNGASFKRDLDWLVLDKAKQLDETAANLLRDPQPPGSPLTQPADAVLPVVVPAGQFQWNPVTSQYLRDRD